MKIAIDITYTPYGGSLTQIIKMIEVFNQIDELDIVILAIQQQPYFRCNY